MKLMVMLLWAALVSTTAFADRDDAHRAATRLTDTLALLANDASQSSRAAYADGRVTQARRYDRFTVISHQIIGTLHGRIVQALADGTDMRSVRMRSGRMQPKFQTWNEAYVNLSGVPPALRQRVVLAKRLYDQVRDELYD